MNIHTGLVYAHVITRCEVGHRTSRSCSWQVEKLLRHSKAPEIIETSPAFSRKESRWSDKSGRINLEIGKDFQL